MKLPVSGLSGMSLGAYIQLSSSLFSVCSCAVLSAIQTADVWQISQNNILLVMYGKSDSQFRSLNLILKKAYCIKDGLLVS